MTADQVVHRMAAECPHLDASVIYDRAGASAPPGDDARTKEIANTGAKLLSAAISGKSTSSRKAAAAPPAKAAVPKMTKSQAQARGGLLAAIRKGTDLTQKG